MVEERALKPFVGVCPHPLTLLQIGPSKPGNMATVGIDRKTGDVQKDRRLEHVYAFDIFIQVISIT